MQMAACAKCDEVKEKKMSLEYDINSRRVLKKRKKKKSKRIR